MPAQRFTVEPLPAPKPPEIPREFEPRRLVRRTVPVLAFFAVVGLVVLFAPGLGEVRDSLSGADPLWLAAGVALEALSCVSYVAMFKPIFCHHMPWRTSWEIGWSELAVGSIVPASGAGGVALGAWILHQGGMPKERIARRSVAFLLIKSSVNFVAVALIGTVMAIGLVGPDLSLWLTALPAAMSVALMAAVALIPRLGPGADPPKDAGRLLRAWVATRRTLVVGTAEAGEIIRSRDWLVLGGAVGYWAFDNAVLWATFHAVGASPDVWIVLMGYLIGQLAGILPIPGGIGAIDGGLIGTLVVYGTPAAATTAAVLAYRVILFWLPLVVGGIAFASLRRALRAQERPELCAVPPATAAPAPSA